MPVISTYEDVCARTLGALSGAWERLQYLAGLRAADGRYLHWGLARTYGEDASQRALGQAHTELFLEILRMPLRSLASEAAAAQIMERLSYVPADLGGGTPEHFNSIVSALAALAEARRPSPTPGA